MPQKFNQFIIINKLIIWDGLDKVYSCFITFDYLNR